MLKAIRTLADLTPDAHNANKHTQRGGGFAAQSVEECGLGRSIVVDKNGKIIGGNQVAETSAELGMEDVIVVPSNGTRLVVVQRTDLDLDSATDQRARRLALWDNRVGEVNLSWDTEELTRLATDLDLSQFWTADEMHEMMGTVPDFAPVGEDEQGRLDEKAKVECPECGHLFSPT
jgi:hypothetical protein